MTRTILKRLEPFSHILSSRHVLRIRWLDPIRIKSPFLFVLLFVALTGLFPSNISSNNAPSVALKGASVRGALRCRSNPHTRAVVYLKPTQSSSVRTQPRTHTMLQQGLRFIPTFLVIQKGDFVAFPNHDPLYHNVFSPSPTRLFNLGIYAPGESRRIRFDKTGVVHVLCHLHPQMHAVIVVIDTPYFAIPQSDHTFQIDDLPPDTYTLGFWTEHCGASRKTTLNLENGDTRTIQIVITPGGPPDILIEGPRDREDQPSSAIPLN